MQKYKKILVPYDFEVHSREALKLATQLADPRAGTVTIVHAFDPGGYQAPSGYVTYDSLQSRELTESLQAQLDAVAGQLVASGAPRVRTHLLEGQPAAAIVQFAGDEHFDLIVMGTHGRTGIWHKLLGSLAQEVLAHAPCPVMTIRMHVPEAASKPAPGNKGESAPRSRTGGSNRALS